jgi:ABC-type Fe3+/spermidine/putrescine transport system ATPase subunit
VLLMDEPLSALDKNLRERMRLEIKHLQKRLGITVVFVTHDQEEALVMADRVAVLDHGRLVQEGPPRALYDEPCNAFVAGFLGETNFLEGDVAEDHGSEVVLRLGAGALARGSVTSGVSLGTRARMSIRPEAIDVLAEPASGSLEGRLREVIFAGNAQILLVDLGLNEPVNVRKPSTFDVGALREGGTVWLRWRPSDARTFAAG